MGFDCFLFINQSNQLNPSVVHLFLFNEDYIDLIDIQKYLKVRAKKNDKYFVFALEEINIQNKFVT